MNSPLFAITVPLVLNLDRNKTRSLVIGLPVIIQNDLLIPAPVTTTVALDVS